MRCFAGYLESDDLRLRPYQPFNPKAEVLRPGVPALGHENSCKKVIYYVESVLCGPLSETPIFFPGTLRVESARGFPLDKHPEQYSKP